MCFIKNINCYSRMLSTNHYLLMYLFMKERSEDS